MNKRTQLVGPRDNGCIPVLDVDPFFQGDQGTAADLAAEVKCACQDTGFLVIANHGTPETLTDQAFAAAAAFFALNEVRKLALEVDEENIDYLPYGVQTMKTSTVQKVCKPNFSESFCITMPDPDPVAYDEASDFNKWPAGMPGFKTNQVDYFKIMRSLANQLLPALALSLGLPEDFFEADSIEPNCTVRLIQYAPQSLDDEDLFGFAHHNDGSFFTILSRSKFPDLEVKAKEDHWIQWSDIIGAFAINTGEMLSRYSNDQFKPKLRRVVNRPCYEPMSSYALSEIKDRTNFPHCQNLDGAGAT